jgi:toxin ParE1/3/4
MLKFRLTADAQSDLIAIRRYTLQQWGLAQSQKYIAGLRYTMQRLAESPYLGKRRIDVAEGVMSFQYESHLIYFMLHENQLVVFGVLHKRMAPHLHLDGRDLG